MTGTGRQPTPPDSDRCASVTTRGTRCRQFAVRLGDGGPLSCGTHLHPDRRAAEESRRLEVEAARLAALPAEQVAAIERRARIFTSGTPGCWSWPSAVPTFEEVTAGMSTGLRQALGSTEEGRAGVIMDHWHAGRCAVCERKHDGALVTDHDHATGLVRGLLCRSCNTREGNVVGTAAAVFAAYRERPPAAILGLTCRYRDPYTGQYAQQSDPEGADVDRVTNSPLVGIGL